MMNDLGFNDSVAYCKTTQNANREYIILKKFLLKNISRLIDINIKLASALNKTLSVIVYATFPSDTKINNQKVEIKKF